MFKVYRYKNPTSLRGKKPVSMVMRGWVLNKTVEDFEGTPKREAQRWADMLKQDVTYRSFVGVCSTRFLEIWTRIL